MDTTTHSPAKRAAAAAGAQAAQPAQPAQTAKLALRRLAMAQLEPTPENYARAYDEELGMPVRPVLPGRAQSMVERLVAGLFRDEASRTASAEAFTTGNWAAFERLIERASDDESAQSAALAGLFERLVRGLERADKAWTLARKKESLQTVFDGSRADARRLQQRLGQLLSSWEGEGNTTNAPAAEAAPADEVAGTAEASAPAAVSAAVFAATAMAWKQALGGAVGSLSRSMPEDDVRSAPVAHALGATAGEITIDGPSAVQSAALARDCDSAERLLKRRHQLMQQMRTLCEELTAGLTDLAEDDSWARGQCEAMRQKLDEGLSARGLRSINALLHNTRRRQHDLRAEREQARDALKSLIHQMLTEVGELGSTTGRFSESVGRYADIIERADSIESLAGAVREMVGEGRAVQQLVSQSQARLNDEHERATSLATRVQALESELRRLSDEVSTDQLTQIANRRGLIRAFDAERARAERGSAGLALGLIDVDNFKRLNDNLGHSAGDEALKALAARIQQQLRPSDMVARYGGEEFVVLLPETPIDDAQQALTRMQRAMTEALFLHDSKPVFVTFSAGVTPYRVGERLEDALERADEALYEAKRTGKNRTCVA